MEYFSVTTFTAMCCNYVIVFRDFQKGDLLRLHFHDGTSAEGEYINRTRNYYHLYKGKFEGENNRLVELAGRVLVKRDSVKIVQVLGQ